jgi:hypothetical protein
MAQQSQPAGEQTADNGAERAPTVRGRYVVAAVAGTGGIDAPLTTSGPVIAAHWDERLWRRLR